MRSPRNIHRPYTVEIVADAWGQVARLPTNTYRAIQARLESLAAGAVGEPALETSDFELEGLTIRYAVDSRRRLIQLLDITRERGHPPASSSGAEDPR